MITTELRHHYGPNVHISGSRLISDLLARVCSSITLQPQFTSFIRLLYQQLLFQILEAETDMTLAQIPTRMSVQHPEQKLSAWQLNQGQRFVSVAISRAGLVPSEVCYEWLNLLFNPSLVRQDHIVAARRTNEAGEVLGTHIAYSKIGGDIQDAIVLLPDPMGATGFTLSEVIKVYKEKVKGKAKKLISMQLIVTPEFIRHMQQTHPDVHIYSLRLDRGLSKKQVLELEPGQKWDEEKGLNDHQYIVPGAGGVGELMNNAFV